MLAGLVALPLLVSCSQKPSSTAQNFDYNLNTASGSRMKINSPAALIANPEATKIAYNCEAKANKAKRLSLA